jgi:hypothetical protein
MARLTYILERPGEKIMRFVLRASLRAFLAGILFFLPFATAEAQFIQYTPPGGPERRPESRKEEIDRIMEEAPWRLGPVRVVPVFGVSDVAYQRSITGPVESPSDITATVEGGFHAYVHTGSKVIWRAQAVPEYVWWREQSGRRNLNGRYDLSAFGFFNRLTAEIGATHSEEQQVFHPEVLRRLTVRRDEGRVTAEVQVSGALSVFATTHLMRQDSLATEDEDPQAAALELLDREELSSRVGVRWRRRNGLSVGLGVERSEAEFEGGLDRSNEGTSPVLEVVWDRPRLFVQADVAARSLEAREGAVFVPYDAVTGSASVRLDIRRSLGVTVYSSRNLVYSVTPGYAYLEDVRLGAAVQSQLGDNVRTRVFAETGSNDFTAFTAVAPERDEDLSSYGGQIGWSLGPLFEVALQALRTEIDSNLPGLDRSYTSVGFTFGLSRGL